MNTGLAEQLATAKESLLVAEQLAAVRSAECKELKRRLVEAEDARMASEARVAESELVRRKLHNTILVWPPVHTPPLLTHGSLASHITT